MSLSDLADDARTDAAVAPLPTAAEAHAAALAAARATEFWTRPGWWAEWRMTRRLRRSSAVAIRQSQQVRSRLSMRAGLGVALASATRPLLRLRRRYRLRRAALELQLFVLRTWKLWLAVAVLVGLWLWRVEILALARQLREALQW